MSVERSLGRQGGSSNCHRSVKNLRYWKRQHAKQECGNFRPGTILAQSVSSEKGPCAFVAHCRASGLRTEHVHW
jgi:hypothetical protein